MAFETHDVAWTLVDALGPLLERVARRDADLARQLGRAGASAAVNVDEGNYRNGADRLHHWRIAAGSAAEVRTALHIARAWRYIEPAAVAGAERLADRLVALLWRLTHSRR
jgi:four helix bundle protein